MALCEQVVGIGAAAHASADAVLVLGPHHPSSHGVLQLALTLDGDTVVQAVPEVGFLHRGAEKLFEVRDYRQLVMLANRHDWLSAFSNELGIVLVVERMLGMQVSDRAVWLRTLLAEVNRVLNHLLFLGASLPTLPPARPVLQGFCEREALQAALADVRTAATTMAAAVHADQAFGARTRGIGLLTAADVLSHGELDVPVVTRTAGDAHARFACVVDQVAVSLDLAETCLARLPSGPVNLRLPKTVRAPEGTTYAWTEGPLGISAYYLVSRGDRVPWRLAMRTASFNNVSALSSALAGVRVQDLVTVLCSFFFVIGDIDK